jgi:hypothetical protein
MKDYVTYYEPEQFEGEFADDDSPQIPSIDAAAALIRNAGEFPNVELLPAVKVRPDNLKKDGSQFILVGEWVLEMFGVDADARGFVMWMVGIADGNYAEPFKSIDEQIAAVYGYKTRAVEMKRAALLAWQVANNTTLIEVREKKFNPEKGRNDPTEYVAHFGEHLTKFIRLAREVVSFQRSPVRALEEAGDKIMRLLGEVKDDLNPDLSIRRKEKKDAQPPKEDKVVKQSDVRRRILRAAQKWSDLEYELSGQVAGGWADLCGELDRIVGTAKERFEAKASSGRLKKQRGRPRK